MHFKFFFVARKILKTKPFILVLRKDIGPPSLLSASRIQQSISFLKNLVNYRIIKLAIILLPAMDIISYADYLVPMFFDITQPFSNIFKTLL